jgi:hypothetical protein
MSPRNPVASTFCFRSDLFPSRRVLRNARRLLQKTYSDGTPTAYYLYDETSEDGMSLSNPIGRMTWEGTSDGTNWRSQAVFSYDSMGRVTMEWQQEPLVWPGGYATYQTYDLVGDLLTYTTPTTPSSITLSQTFNVAGLQTQLGVPSNPGLLASGVHYNGAGELTVGHVGKRAHRDQRVQRRPSTTLPNGRQQQWNTATDVQ